MEDSSSHFLSLLGFVEAVVLNTVFESTEFEPRCDDKHIKECDLLNGPLYEHYSRTYGINRRSVLINIPFYSMFSGGLPHDIMHDVIASLEVSLLLRNIIQIKKDLTLEE